VLRGNPGGADATRTTTDDKEIDVVI
jgi:hypothetical protein